jgi:signal peptidase I
LITHDVTLFTLSPVFENASPVQSENRKRILRTSGYRGNTHIRVSAAEAIVVALILFAAIKLFAFDVLLVEGHSMEPALSPGRIVFVNRLAYGILVPFIDAYIVTWASPSRGSIIV